jgi:hypothetical protein
MRISLGWRIARCRAVALRCAAAVIALLAPPLMSTAGAQATQGTAVIVGQVTDAWSGQGIPSATLQMEGTRLGAVIAPDIEMENDVASAVRGRDPQLERAVQEALRLLALHPVPAPTRPPPIDRAPRKLPR